MRSLTAEAVAAEVGGKLIGPGEVLLRQVRSLAAAGPDALSLCQGPRWAGMLASSSAGAVILPEDLSQHPGPATRIVVTDTSAALATAAKLFHADYRSQTSIAVTARIGTDTIVGADPSIGEYVVIGERVTIGARVRIGAHAVIEDGVVIGDDVRLDSQVVVHAGSVIGSRVWCQAGAVIGGAGFGFVSDATGHHRSPQVGGCVLEDDVEIGSCSCVDRGSLDDTIIGRGTKLDNHVHVGHNVRIGSDCLLMAGVGVAGSARIGNGVILAGQAGVGGHLKIGDRARVGAKSGVISNVAAGEDVWGIPSRPHRDYLRAMAALYRLAPHYKALELLARKGEEDG